MNPLGMAAREVFGQDTAPLLFGREDQMVETFLCDRPDGPFRGGIPLTLVGRAVYTLIAGRGFGGESPSRLFLEIIYDEACSVPP